VLTTPTLTESDKNGIVAELQKAIGAAGSGETVKNFLATLAENNRLGLLQEVCDKFGELISASRGEVEMIVTSAQVRHFAKTLAWSHNTSFSSDIATPVRIRANQMM
jgi:F0F1-type ATP synthase delta subunit